MNSNNFFSSFHIKPTNFFDGYVPLKPKTYCIVIIYDNGHKYEKYGIENPWKYLAALRKNPRIKDAFIKDENNH